MVDLRALEVFLEVSETLSFTRAAEHLRISPSVVTETIQRLERELDLKLLERTSRRVSLTPAGASYAADAARIMERLSSAAHRARCSARGARGTVRLGVTLHPASQVATRLVSRAAKELEDVTVETSAHFSLDQVRLLRGGEIDLGVAIEPELDKDIEHIVLTRLDWMLVLPTTHPLAALKRVPVTALASQPVAHVGPAAHRPAHDVIRGAFRAAGVDPVRLTDTVDDQSLIRAVLEAGCLGVALWNWADTAPPQVTARPFEPPGIPALDLDLIWLVDSQNPAVPAMTAVAEAMAREGAFADLRPT